MVASARGCPCECEFARPPAQLGMGPQRREGLHADLEGHCSVLTCSQRPQAAPVAPARQPTRLIPQHRSHGPLALQSPLHRSSFRSSSSLDPPEFGLAANSSMAAAGRSLPAVCRAAFSLASAASTSAAAPAALAQLSLRGGAGAAGAAGRWGGLQQHAAAAAGLRQLARVSGMVGVACRQPWPGLFRLQPVCAAPC